MKRKADGQLHLIPLHSVQAELAHASYVPETPAGAGAETDKVLVIKRDGTTEPFYKSRIALAIESAFKAVRDIPVDESLNPAMNQVVVGLVEKISKNLLENAAQGASLDVEYIQDSVENQLMCDGFLTEARRFILYREDRRKLRKQKEVREAKAQSEPVAEPVAEQILEPATEQIVPPLAEPPPAPTPSIAPVDEKRRTESLLKMIYSEAIPNVTNADDFAAAHRRHFSYAIQDGVHNNQLARELVTYELEHLADALRLERDKLIEPEGLEWLYGNCFVRQCDRCVDTPQYFWMRLAMALAANEDDEPEARALEFYEILSTLRFLPSEKLLRNTGRSGENSSRGLDGEGSESILAVAGHVNIAAHIENGVLDELLLYGTVSSSVRLLDNALDTSRYSLEIVAQRAHEQREIGLGMVGFDRALEMLGIAAESTEADQFVNRVAESVAYYATLASASLAAERDSFPAHEESNWMLGMLPFESLKFSQAGCGDGLNGSCTKDWLAVRTAIRKHGLRNGRLLALTPAYVVEKFVGDAETKVSFAAQLNWLARCRKWVDGPLWITAPRDWAGTESEEAQRHAQSLGIRVFTPPVPVTNSEPFIDAAAASKVLKGIEKTA